MTPLALNAADILILVVTSLSCILGLWRGLIKEVLSLATWVAALLAVWLYSESFAAVMPAFIEQPLLRYLTAFLILFLGVMIIGNLLATMLTSMLAIAGLTMMDRMLGGVFGAMRGAVIVCLVIFVAGPFLEGTELWSQSVLVPYSLALIEWSETIIAQSQGEVVI